MSSIGYSQGSRDSGDRLSIRPESKNAARGLGILILTAGLFYLAVGAGLFGYYLSNRQSLGEISQIEHSPRKDITNHFYTPLVLDK